MNKFVFSLESWGDVKESFSLDDLGFTQEEWDAMSKEEQEKELDDYGRELVQDYISWSFVPEGK